MKKSHQNTVPISGAARLTQRLAAIALAATLVATMMMVLSPLPAHASAGEHRITGTACHNYDRGWSDPWLPWWYWIGSYEDCLTIEASTSGASPGRVILEEVQATAEGGFLFPRTTTAANAAIVTLNCLVVETTSSGHRIFAGGTDTLGTPYAITLTTSAQEWGFSAGTPTGGAPCGAHAWVAPTNVGSFEVSHDSQEANELPSAEFAYECVRLTCTFDAGPSFDPDGSIVSHRWQFGSYGEEGGSGEMVTHTFPQAGTHVVELTVVDDDGGADSISRNMDVGKSPTAALSFSCNRLTCDFDASQSSDPDGTIVEYVWYFGDTQEWVTTTIPTVTHTSKTADAYYATLWVEDDDGMGDRTSAFVDLRVPFDLSGRFVRQGKRARVDLTWSGAMTEQVDVYRDGAKIATVSNTGSYSDPVPTTGSSITYRICDYASTRCSNDAIVHR